MKTRTRLHSTLERASGIATAGCLIAAMITHSGTWLAATTLSALLCLSLIVATGNFGRPYDGMD